MWCSPGWQGASGPEGTEGSWQVANPHAWSLLPTLHSLLCCAEGTQLFRTHGISLSMKSHRQGLCGLGCLL